MVIKGGKIFTEDGVFADGTVVVQDGKIQEIDFRVDAGGHNDLKSEKNKDEVEILENDNIDTKGMYVIPGLVDIHFHGCVGVDFCDGTKEAFDAITKYEMEHGITSIVPATMTLSREELARIFKAAGDYTQSNGSTLCGINMEGPFVSMAKKGAQNGDYIHKPDIDFYRQMQELSGRMIKQVAVAPEEDEDYVFVREVSKETVVSVAHTTANYDTAKKAFENGANHVTHLFNAMPGFLHRDPGVVGAAFDSPDTYVEMICDGVHIHSAMVRAMFALFGSKRICMISDSMMATGLEDGDYSLGGQPVKVVGKLATLADGTIAGSASNLMDCLRVAVQDMGIPLEDAIRSCTITPAKSLGIDGDCGSISVGKRADFVVLDEALNICMVIKDGKIVVQN